MTQNEMIINHLREYGSITQLEALRDYGCMRLASRISDLRKTGIKIIRLTETSRNRYGQKIRYARYIMEENENAE